MQVSGVAGNYREFLEKERSSGRSGNVVRRAKTKFTGQTCGGGGAWRRVFGVGPGNMSPSVSQ